MNIHKIIPDGSQLGNVTRYYLFTIWLLLCDTFLRSNSISSFLDIVSLNSPVYVLAATIVIILWRVAYKQSAKSVLTEYLLAGLIPVIAFLCSVFINQAEISMATLGQISIFSGVTYCFSYVDYYKKQAMTPIRNELLLASLQQKLKPHFLFNSINTVLGIIRDDVRLAERLLEDLSELFRNLAVDDRETYTFQEDLDLTLKYLDIENIRMSNNINLITEIDTRTLQCKVPFLLLQPLVENCIHYGAVDKTKDGLLRISTKKTSNGILIILENNLKSNTVPIKGAGTTLTNLKKRLALMYDVESILDAYTVKGMYRIQIRIPDLYSY